MRGISDGQVWGSVHVPWLGVVLGKFELVLCDDVGILVEDDESCRTVTRPVSIGQNVCEQEASETYVVPQSRLPTNSPCFNSDIVRANSQETQVGIGCEF